MSKSTSVSRRSFLKGLTASALGAAALTACSAPASSGAAASSGGTAAGEGVLYADTIPWNATFDTVIVGFGGAGAAAAIEAHDKGLTAVVVEKAPEGLDGGNTHYSSQRFLTIKKEDRDKAIEYMKEVRGLYTDNMSDEIIEYLVDGYTETLDWFDSIGGQNYEVKVDPEYPDFVNADVICKCYTGDNYNFWPVVRRAAMSRRDDKLQIWFSTPCEKMIQDPVSKEILGVQVTRNKETLNLRATRGVILAAGGFEASNEMIQNYVQLPYAIPLGSHYNTGEVIKQAQAVGADL